ncbi:MAG: Fe-Mn family superoxide dismutase [Betaproteobacteria bacterium]
MPPCKRGRATQRENDRRYPATAVRSVEAARAVAAPYRVALPQQLLARGAPARGDSGAALRARLGRDPGLRAERAEARRADRRKLGGPPRAVLRLARRRWRAAGERNSRGGHGRPAKGLRLEAWRSAFTALALGLAGGAGWALLSWSDREHRLVNQWAGDHSQLLAGATPILALDVYEHSYHIDFGADAKAYVAAFMDNIDWDQVAARHKAAVTISTAVFAMTAEAAHGSPQLPRIDVRRDGAYAAASEIIEGAVWRDPVHADDWGREFLGRQVLVYCVHGNAVGRSTAARLRRLGASAFFLAGGIENWKAEHRPLASKPA